MCASQLELQISGTHTTEENSNAVEEIKGGEIGRKTSTLVHSLFHPVGQQCFLHPNMRLLVRVGMIGVKGLSIKEKGLMNMDNRVVIARGRRV